jgi:Na+/proline symporter
MVISLELLPAVLSGVVLAAVISAILSTVSSQLLVAASAVSYDVVEGVAGRHPDDRRSLVLGRLTVALVGLVGIALALSEARLVFWFVLFAWSILGASFGPLILLALSRVAINRHGALAGMLVGLGVSVVWKLGRDAAREPVAFGRLAWIVLAVAVVLLAAGRLRGRLGRGETVAVVVAALVTLGAGGAVQLGPLDELYELVPAFSLSAAAVPLVSRITVAD